MLQQMPTADGQNLWECWVSPYWLPSIMAADAAEMFSALAQAPAAPEVLAQRLALNPRAVGAVLPLLASLGLLAPRLGRFHLTDTARHYLLADSPFYWGGVMDLTRDRNPVYEALLAVLRSPDLTVPELDAPVERHTDEWASGAFPPELARAVARYMQSHSATSAVSLAQNADFAAVKRLLDVGGGSGCYSIALARANPGLRCTVMDLAPMCDEAEGYIARAGLEDRIDTHAADMFRDPWPAGYDAILFSNIFHDWRFDSCAVLARRAFDALPPGGTINLHEALLNDDGSGPRVAAGMSVLMVITTQGQQFTFGQLHRLLADAGFVDIECRASSPIYSLVRGRKP